MKQKLCCNKKISVSDFSELEPDSLVGYSDISQCNNTMDAYKLLMTNFINLQTILKQNLTGLNNETVIKSIDDYQSSLFGYKTVSDLYSECYWFESHLWWRAGPKLRCLPNELQTKTDKEVNQSELKALTNYIKGTIG